MITGSIHHEDLIFVNIYALNIETTKYIKQALTLMKVKTDNNTIMVGTSILHFQQWLDHPDKTINKGTLDLQLSIRPDDRNRHIQNILPNSSRVHILLKCT